MPKTVEEATSELKSAIAAFGAVIDTDPDREKLKAARDTLDDAIVATFRDLEGDVEGAKVSKEARDILRDADAELESRKGGRRRRGRKTRGRKTRGRRHTRSRTTRRR